jgi:hypothetical protein
MAPIVPESVVVRREDPLTARIDDEIVMLDLTRSQYFGLDATGAEVWELLDGSRSVEAACARLTERYDVDLDTCRDHVLAFVGELAEAGLVEVRDVDGSRAHPGEPLATRATQVSTDDRRTT